MKTQSATRPVVTAAFESANGWRRARRQPSPAELDNVFDALDVVFSALSKTKRQQLLPPTPKKRGRKRTEYEFAIAWFLVQALTAERRWSDAVEATRQELLARSLQLPDVDDSTLRRILDRYKRGDMRPRLLPRKIHP